MSLDNNWNKEIIKAQAAPVLKILENSMQKMLTKVIKIYASRSKNVQKGFMSLT